MKHALIGETRQKAENIIRECDRDGVLTIQERAGNRYFVRTKWSGRVDEIRVIVIESEVHGHRFDGQLITYDESSGTDMLLMYARHNLRREQSFGGTPFCDDAETVIWHNLLTGHNYHPFDLEQEQMIAELLKSLKRK